MHRCTGRFRATGDDGRTYTVEVWTEFRAAREEPSGEVEGVQSLLASPGLNLKRLDKGRYQIIATGVILRCTDPDTP
jgi:hypothetical protein